MFRNMRWGGILGILIFSACTSFDQSDDGGSSKVLIGETFTVTLPSQPAERIPRIEKDDVVTFLAFRKNPSTDEDVFVFKAIGVGESAIHISKGSASQSPDFLITIKVVLGGSPYP